MRDGPVSEVAVTDQEGAEAASFEAFVAARGRALWRTAWLLTGDHHKAEDLVQTALGKAWPHYDRVASTGSFEAYVRKTMLTTYLAWWRRRWNAEYPTAEPPDPQQAGPQQADPAEQAGLRRDVVAALARLPRGQRAAVVLRYFDDLTEAQAAEALGCSVGTVKSQTSRALAALRSSPLLANDEVDDR
jgi:RNA polymerase sigma-70 factor (sigma-E family)